MKNNIPNIESSNNSFLTAKTAGFLVGLKEKKSQKDEIIQTIATQDSTTNNETISNVEENSIVQEPTQIFNAPLIGENVSVAVESPAITNPEIQENISTEENSVIEENVPTETEIINPEIQENISTEENSVIEENVPTETEIINPEIQENISTEENSVTDENTSTQEENNSEQTVSVVEKHTIDEVDEAENEFAVAPIIPSTPTTVQAEDTPQQQEKLQEELVNSNPSSIFNIPLIAATPAQESITADNTNTNTVKMKEQDENTESSNINNNSENKATEQPTVETTAAVAGLNTNIDYFNFEFKTSQPEKEEIKTELSLDEETMKFDFNSVIREPENKGTLDTPTEKIDLDKFLEPKENLIKKAEEAEETDNNVIRIKEDNNAKSQNGRKYLLYGFYVLLLIVAIFFCIRLYKNSTNFSLTRTEITLAINSTYQAEVVSNSKIQDNKKYQWTTSNDKVVTVDENGLITSVGGGEATIFVERGSHKQELKVTAVAIEITSIAFKDKELTLKVGDEQTLQAIINDDESIVIDLIWESSDTSVITVDENGHVVAVGEGTASVQVYDDISGKAGELQVTVNPSKNGDKPAEKPEEPTVDKEKVEVTGVALNKSDLIMEVDEYVVVSAVVRPANATDKKVTWSSSNKNVATVSSTGKITARAEGTATITAKTTNGKKASLKVTVTKKFVNVTGVTLNKETATLDVGESLTLNATVAPKNATNPKVTWSTSDASVATVNNGKVTAKAPGTATITVTSSDGNKKAVCTITVKEKVIIKVDKITLSENSIELITGNSKTITATVTPDNATDKTVNWSTSNADVATVSNGKITATGAGTATITATSSDGSQSATCTVKVTDPIVEATGVSLNKTQITLKVGETFQLTATIKPSNTSNKTLTWSSLKSSKASVDENGLVTALKAGTTVITVKTSNGKSATCSVTVEEATVAPDPEPEPTPES